MRNDGGGGYAKQQNAMLATEGEATVVVEHDDEVVGGIWVWSGD